VTLYEFLTGIPPFNDETPEKIFERILDRRMISHIPMLRESHRNLFLSTELEWPENPEEMSEDARDLISKLLHLDPSKRLGSNGVQVSSIRSRCNAGVLTIVIYRKSKTILSFLMSIGILCSPNHCTKPSFLALMMSWTLDISIAEKTEGMSSQNISCSWSLLSHSITTDILTQIVHHLLTTHWHTPCSTSIYQRSLPILLTTTRSSLAFRSKISHF